VLGSLGKFIPTRNPESEHWK